MTREEAARLSLDDRRAAFGRLGYDECAALGYDECGLSLEACPGAPKPRPLSERGERVPPFGAASAGMGRGIQVRRPGRPWASR